MPPSCAPSSAWRRACTWAREHASQLLALGCSTGQGYFFAKPMPSSETNELLRTMRAGTPLSANPTLEIVRVS